MWNTVYNALTTKTLLNIIESLLDGSKAIQNPVGVPDHQFSLGGTASQGVQMDSVLKKSEFFFFKPSIC